MDPPSSKTFSSFADIFFYLGYRFLKRFQILRLKITAKHRNIFWIDFSVCLGSLSSSLSQKQHPLPHLACYYVLTSLHSLTSYFALIKICTPHLHMYSFSTPFQYIIIVHFSFQFCNLTIYNCKKKKNLFIYSSFILYCIIFFLFCDYNFILIIFYFMF